ncbi:hypothetical protein AGLY_014597 [Aphis glycines]|uniref:Transmembrane protein n=1 Tax=Aphis glycines TaxID=307491 RepID=A0A6G0T3R8_APHGL|nr:hypothetical protein AGLY_014597 [Aphis glycines]
MHEQHHLLKIIFVLNPQKNKNIMSSKKCALPFNSNGHYRLLSTSNFFHRALHEEIMINCFLIFIICPLYLLNSNKSSFSVSKFFSKVFIFIFNSIIFLSIYFSSLKEFILFQTDFLIVFLRNIINIASLLILVKFDVSFSVLFSKMFFFSLPRGLSVFVEIVCDSFDSCFKGVDLHTQNLRNPHEQIYSTVVFYGLKQTAQIESNNNQQSDIVNILIANLFGQSTTGATKSNKLTLFEVDNTMN